MKKNYRYGIKQSYRKGGTCVEQVMFFTAKKKTQDAFRQLHDFYMVTHNFNRDVRSPFTKNFDDSEGCAIELTRGNERIVLTYYMRV